MMQSDMENDVRNHYKFIKTYDSYMDEDSMLVLHEDYPCLCRVDLDAHTAKVIQWISHPEEKLRRLFYSAVFAGDKAVLIPGEAGRVDVVDTHSGETASVELNLESGEGLTAYDAKDPFFRGFIYNSFAYLLGATYSGILKLNLETREIACSISANLDKDDYIHIHTKNYYFANGYAIRGSSAYLPLGIVPAIGKLNMETDEIALYRFDDEIRLVHGLIDRGSDILILIEDDKNRLYLCRWDETNGITEKIYVDETDNTDGVSSFYWEPIEAGGDIFLFPMNKGKAYRVNTKSQSASVCKIVMEVLGCWPEKNWRYMITLLGKRNNKVFFQTIWDRQWHEYDTLNDKMENYSVIIDDDEYIRRRWKPYLRQQSILFEKEIMLDDYLRAIAAM